MKFACKLDVGNTRLPRAPPLHISHHRHHCAALRVDAGVKRTDTFCYSIPPLDPRYADYRTVTCPPCLPKVANRIVIVRLTLHCRGHRTGAVVFPLPPAFTTACIPDAVLFIVRADCDVEFAYSSRQVCYAQNRPAPRSSCCHI